MDKKDEKYRVDRIESANDNEYDLMRKEMEQDGICRADIEMAINLIKKLRHED